MTKLDKNIWRGPQPTSLSDYAELANLGIKTTLDLENGFPNFGDVTAVNLQSMAGCFKIEVLQLPLGELFPPTKNELSIGAGYLNDHAQSGIYVHCRAGHNRTGMICAAYRMKFNGWSKDLARAEMHQAGMDWWFYWWGWFL